MILRDNSIRSFYAWAWASARLDFSAIFAIMLLVLLIPLGGCERLETRSDAADRESGAQVSFGVELSGLRYGSPEHADVTIDGKLICSVQHMSTSSVFLPKGDYRVRVSADGFESVEKDISVQSSSTQEFHFKLRSGQ